MDLEQYIGHNQVTDHPSRCQHNIRRYYAEYYINCKARWWSIKIVTYLIQ